MGILAHPEWKNQVPNLTERPHDVTTSAELGRGAYRGPRNHPYVPRIKKRRSGGWRAQCIAGTRGEITNRAGVR